jgi:hypothetical protein
MALTIALTLVAGALVLWQTRSHDTVPPSANLPLSQGDLSAQTDEARSTTRPSQPEADTPKKASQSAAVTPTTPRKSCKHGIETKLDTHGSGDQYTCIRPPYESYSSETLESLAYGDAEAASILAYRVRHTDYPKALKLALRSAALSGGETSTLMSATSWRPLVDENGEPSLSGYGQIYVLHSVIERLRGSAYTRPVMYENKIYELSGDPEQTVRELDNIVERIIAEMEQIELDVTGNSTLGGRDDA